MKYGKALLGLLLFVLIVQILILSPKSVEEAPSSVHMTAVDSQLKMDDVDQLMQGVHLIESRGTEKEWELWADEARSLKDKNIWALTTVKAVFFGEDGVFFTVTGETGEVEIGSKNMEVMGNVVTRSSNGYVFRTEKVIYNSEKRFLHSPTPVDMRGPRDAHGEYLTLVGDKMDADLNLSLMEVTGSVRADKTFSGPRKVIIRSERSQFSGKSRVARFEGNVVIDVDTMRLTGPVAEFDYDSSSDVVKSLMVHGGARVSDVDKWATSQNVEVLFEDNKYIFRGNPRVVQEGDDLRGEEIVFYNGGERVVVEGARSRVDERRMERLD